MKLGLIVAAVTVLGLGGIAGGCALIGVSAKNGFVVQENGVKAQYDQNQNNYDNFIKSLREAAQVPEMYTDDLRKVYSDTMRGRYGADGSKAMFQFIQEHNPNVDSAVYVKLQQIIESGRASFQADQKALIDKKRVYESSLEVWPGSIWAGVYGYPRIDLAKYGIVTSDETEKAFATKRSEPTQLRKP